jgi:hypothetical protein
MHSNKPQHGSISCYRSGRTRILATPLLLAVLTLGGCGTGLEYDAESGGRQIFLQGEEKYAKLTDAQRDAFNTVRQEFSDPIQHPTLFLIGYAQALYPELWGIKTPDAGNLKLIADARQKKITAAITAASQTAISSQMTLNAPSQDANANPTTLESRRSEAANGHPAY